ncbi:unnamed protein product [Leuciscus chuanchicus]
MADLNPPLTGLCYPGSGEMQIDSRSEVAFFEGLSILRALSFQARLEESQISKNMNINRVRDMRGHDIGLLTRKGGIKMERLNDRKGNLEKEKELLEQ